MIAGIALLVLIGTALIGVVFGWSESVIKWLKGSALVTGLGYGTYVVNAIGSWLWDKAPRMFHAAANVLWWLFWKALWPLGMIALGIFMIVHPIGTGTDRIGIALLGVIFISLPACLFVMFTLIPTVRFLRQPKLQKFEYSESAADPEELFRIIHISDIHITGVEGAKTLEQKSFESSEFKNTLNRIRGLNADVVVVTGDITDSGDQPAWDLFSDYFCESGLDTPTIVIPGNHDFVLSKTMRSDDLGMQVQLRICRFLKVLHRVLTPEFRSMENDTGDIVSSKELLAGGLSFIEYYLTDPPRFRGGRDIDVFLDWDHPIQGTPPPERGPDFDKPQRILAEIYPLALPTNKEHLIIALNSIQYDWSADFIAENAIGFIEKEQFERLRRLVAQYGPSNVVVCLHHPPGLRRLLHKSALLHLQNSPKLLAVCKEINCNLILHGHAHDRHFSKIKNVQVVCPGASIKNPTSIVTYLLDRGRIVNILDYCQNSPVTGLT